MQASASKSSTVEECHEYWKKAATIIRKEIKLLNLDPYQLLNSDPKKYVNLRPNDVVIASYPRSGGNFVSEILYNIVRKIRERYHMEHMEYEIKVYEEAEAEVLPDTSDGKIYTSKLRYNYLAKHAKKNKIIYVIRNPKHAALELYNAFYIKHMSFREFVDIFLGSIDPTNPYNYKTHFLQYLNNEQELDILFLKYEEVDQNPDKAVRNILEHLGLSEVTFSKKEVQGMLGVREENILTSWDVISKSVRTRNFSSFFDTDLLVRFDEELKVDWKLVNSGNV